MAEQIDDSYKEVIHWTPNIWLLTKCNASEEFVDILSSQYEMANNDEAMNVGLKSATVICQLLLQKSNSSKTKVIRKCLERRLLLWKERKLQDLIIEARLIQHKFVHRRNEVVRQASCKGASSWLSSKPLKHLGYTMKKIALHDAVAARYNWIPPNCPLVCACGEKFSVRHALACQTGGLAIVRHNVVRDFLSEERTKVGCTVTVEIELSKFYPVIMSSLGGVGPSAQIILQRVALKSAIRNGLQYGECIQRLRTALSFKLAKMASTCIREARTRNPEHRTFLM
ncbi:hypothetical protein GJ496_005854 [Pomphorhynchus laevis]|nr:hypothetical protein GJ496_005854 [Pomphorhynchus laevis]